MRSSVQTHILTLLQLLCILVYASQTIMSAEGSHFETKPGSHLNFKFFLYFVISGLWLQKLNYWFHCFSWRVSFQIVASFLISDFTDELKFIQFDVVYFKLLVFPLEYQNYTFIVLIFLLNIHLLCLFPFTFLIYINSWDFGWTLQSGWEH